MCHLETDFCHILSSLTKIQRICTVITSGFKLYNFFKQLLNFKKKLRIKTQCHCPWLLSQPSLPATFRVSILITCSIPPSPAGLGELLLDQSHSLSGWTHPSWSRLLCSHSPSFCSSFGPRELSPVLQSGTLSLSPFITRWRFYGDMQDTHQCGYGTRPVQALFPLLPKDLAGDISLDLGTPLESSLLQPQNDSFN